MLDKYLIIEGKKEKYYAYSPYKVLASEKPCDFHKIVASQWQGWH